MIATTKYLLRELRIFFPRHMTMPLYVSMSNLESLQLLTHLHCRKERLYQISEGHSWLQLRAYEIGTHLVAKDMCHTTL